MREVNSSIAYRLRTVRVGVQVTFFVLVPLVAFLFIPSSIPVETPTFVTALVVAGIGGVIVALLPWLKLFETGWGLRVMYAWSVLDVLIITVILSSVGENGVPFFVLYALTTAFAAASYRPRALIALVAFTMASYVTMLLVFEERVIIASTVVQAAVLIGIALITGFLSGELIARNERLEQEINERLDAEARLKASRAQLAEAQAAERDQADLAARQQQAMEINDNVVQGLTVAAYSLEANDEERAAKAIRATLGAARKIVEELLSGRLDKMKPGDFVRTEAANLDIEKETTQR